MLDHGKELVVLGQRIRRLQRHGSAMRAGAELEIRKERGRRGVHSGRWGCLICGQARGGAGIRVGLRCRRGARRRELLATLLLAINREHHGARHSRRCQARERHFEHIRILCRRSDALHVLIGGYGRADRVENQVHAGRRLEVRELQRRGGLLQVGDNVQVCLQPLRAEPRRRARHEHAVVEPGETGFERGDRGAQLRGVAAIHRARYHAHA